MSLIIDSAYVMLPAQPTQLDRGVLVYQVTMQADLSGMRHAAWTPNGEQAKMTCCMQAVAFQCAADSPIAPLW